MTNVTIPSNTPVTVTSIGGERTIRVTKNDDNSVKFLVTNPRGRAGITVSTTDLIAALALTSVTPG